MWRIYVVLAIVAYILVWLRRRWGINPVATCFRCIGWIMALAAILAVVAAVVFHVGVPRDNTVL
jgi:hypothetical protein